MPKTRQGSLAGTILLALIVCTSPNLVAQTREPWTMHDGAGVQSLSGPVVSHGNPATVYELANIPAEDDPDWLPLPNKDNPSLNGDTIGFERGSAIPAAYYHPLCLENEKGQVDYTYFQTDVTVPEGVTVTQFEIEFSGMDDGSRITIFNSKHPNGIIDEDSYVLNKPRSANLQKFLAPGKNRVVITQVDDCCCGNNLRSAVVKLNGETVPVQPPPPPEPPTTDRFACTGETYVVQDQRARISRVDETVSPFQFIDIGGRAASEINNLGFRVTDGLLYGLELSGTGNVQVVQIGPSGTAVGLGRPPGLPTGPRFDSGDVSPDGNAMYITANGQDLYRLDLTKVPTLPAVTKVAVTGDAGAVHDWAVHPTGSALYGGDSAQGQVAKIDPKTGKRTDSSVAGLPKGTAYGGAWFDAGGHLFLYQNSGTIYEIDLAGPSVVGTQKGPASDRNDAAACIAKPKMVLDL
jgi:Repeat of unknown function (DUF6923)